MGRYATNLIFRAAQRDEARVQARNVGGKGIASVAQRVERNEDRLDRIVFRTERIDRLPDCEQIRGAADARTN